MVKSTPVESGCEPELRMNHATQQRVSAKVLSIKMHCVTHSLCFYYHYKLREYLMNNRVKNEFIHVSLCNHLL